MPSNQTDKPDFLRLSAAQIEENERQQAQLRRKFNSRMKLTPAEEERARAMVMIPTLRESIELYPSDANLRETFAEALASLGQYEKAASVSREPERIAFYEKVNAAIWREDSDECECSPDIQILDNQRIQMPKFRILKEIYSLKHARVMNLLEETCCLSWNVRALTEDLAAMNRAAAHNQTADNKISDVDLLKIK